MRTPRFLLAAALAGMLGATATPAWSLDLMAAYQAALAQDARIRAARAARDSAIERLPQARAQLMPNIAINIGRNKNDVDRTQESVLGREVEVNEEYFSYNQTLQLRQPLFRMPLFAGLRQAGYLVDDAEATLERELQDLGARVSGAYMEALLAQDALELTLKQKAFTTTQLDAARKSLAAGFGTRTDIDEAQARLDMNLADELSARQHVEFTRRQLEILIDQPVDALLKVDAKRLPLLPPEPADVAEWIRMAEEHSPEVHALQARVDAARAEIAKARGGHYPTVDAVAQISKSGSENVTSPRSSYTNHMIGVQVNIPLFAGGYVNSTVRQAVAEQVRAQENLEATRRDLAVRVHREHRGVTEGVLKVRALEQAVRSAQQLVTSSKRSFEAGSRSMVDVLDAEQRLQGTLHDLAEARYLYLVSRVRLKALVGMDREQSIGEVNGWLGS
ncbi:TolC family outer membrane protein [Thauera sp.]|jgi:outer membrane protein/protease secretion system outer membrane protein|uniref:TolC family outer membrane protein n=1 Tax=Thauera sp. TaxID=1905334 RepID=UPI00262CC775|nr:TolC family outer membrane protein [Thauera sp.]MCK6409347.1 TolC family outer membrane protein [Thauera sp.]